MQEKRVDYQRKQPKRFFGVVKSPESRSLPSSEPIAPVPVPTTSSKKIVREAPSTLTPLEDSASLHLIPLGSLQGAVSAFTCCGWCKFNWALANSEPSPPHSPTIHPDIVPPLKKVFERHSHPALMERCVLGETQNQNESFNTTVWQRCPKTEFCSATLVEIADNLAVTSFNSGQVPFTKLQERLEVTVSSLTRQYLSDKDHHSMSALVMMAEALVKRKRQALHLDGVALEEQQVEERERPMALGGFSHHRTGRTYHRSSTTTISSKLFF